MTIVIVDYDVGNIESVANMVRKAGGNVQISSDPIVIAQAKKLILPGVGSFDKGMIALEKGSMKGAIYNAVERGAGILGICLGMQLMLDRSEEGSLPGLGLISGQVHLFPRERKLKVPHMGWNCVYPTKCSALFPEVGIDPLRFYFVHSYYAKCTDAQDVAATTEYGFEFTSAFSKNNIHGVQFHPEKSHRFGMALIHRFLDS